MGPDLQERLINKPYNEYQMTSSKDTQRNMLETLKNAHLMDVGQALNRCFGVPLYLDQIMKVDDFFMQTKASDLLSLPKGSNVQGCPLLKRSH